ncbi:hypothetical protein [Yinghuangia seranimata]|uniref:hypothetical protein n=1 Tax=Yinghuangia seranimata TaxID=408067 RepID=UPI00248CEBA9|nr:hypothetical protein [Yinghuangia seranimata]MDI2126815.1 hypothetical protein [Yinghuangia seranimata]
MAYEAIQAAGIVGAIQAVRCGKGREFGIGGSTGVAAVTPTPGPRVADEPHAGRVRRRRTPRGRDRVHVWEADPVAGDADPADADLRCGTEGRR